MTKKGSMLVFIAIIGIVVAAFVFLALPKIADEYASGKVALKTAAARDIALILDTIYSSSYDIELDYPVDLSGFTVEISDNTVKIYDTSLGELDPLLAQYSFVPIKDEASSTLPSFTLTGPNGISFVKTGSALSIT